MEQKQRPAALWLALCGGMLLAGTRLLGAMTSAAALASTAGLGEAIQRALLGSLLNFLVLGAFDALAALLLLVRPRAGWLLSAAAAGQAALSAVGGLYIILAQPLWSILMQLAEMGIRLLLSAGIAAALFHSRMRAYCIPEERPNHRPTAVWGVCAGSILLLLVNLGMLAYSLLGMENPPGRELWLAAWPILLLAAGAVLLPLRPAAGWACACAPAAYAVLHGVQTAVLMALRLEGGVLFFVAGLAGLLLTALLWTQEATAFCLAPAADGEGRGE